MGFRWVAPNGSASEAADAGLGQEFPTQADAEAWLTASYEALVDADITEVTLWADDQVVYGPMSLLA